MLGTWKLACSMMPMGALVVLTGCATIMHGSNQHVDFDSTPPGASVTVDGKVVGTTPTGAELDRGSEHDVVISLQGYTPFEMHLSRGVDGWFFANLLLGGVIGLVVDASNGSMYKLDKDRVSVMLVKTTSSNSRGDFHIVVVEHVDPGLEKIGQMQRLE